MSENVYPITELVGTSTSSIEDAISNAVTTASKTLKNVEWFEVTRMSGHIVDGKVAHFQVMLKLGFRYEK
jgi:flavin-binding protein dodecin